MAYDPRFDDMFFGILNNVGTIEKFLDVVYSFLYRRTDFFKVKRSDSEKLGLPPGMAQKILKVISQRYMQLEKAKMSGDNSESCPLPAKEEKAVKSAEKKLSSKQGEINNNTPNVDHIPKDHLTKENDSHKDKEVETATEAQERVMEASGGLDEEKEKQDAAAKEEEERRYYTSNPESYNGASYDNYSWSQNNFELDVQVKVPNGIKTCDQLKIGIEKTHLKVEAFKDEKWEMILDGNLSYEIKPKTSMWTLHPHDHVHVNLEKGYPRYWEALLEGEPKINVRTIDCSIPFEDIDEEAQAKLQQMMFDQHQKRLGKPTSEDMKVQEMLKQAWDKKDSPFRGQKFDPSILRMNQ